MNRVGGTILIPTVRSSPTLDQTSAGTVQTGQQFITGVVKEFFVDPKSLSEYDTNKLKQSVKESRLVDRMPINSLHCVVIENGRRDEHIAYPFFSQHLCIPVKPGEQIWLMREENLYYWVCRKTGDYTTEDINYTHVDRIVNFKQPTAQQAFGDELVSESFPNGLTNSQTDSTLGVNLDYKKITEESQTYKEQFVPGPVPRLTRKPGDLVLQGSNNSAIILSDDAGQGNIKLIAGRKIVSEVVSNDRNYSEIDKKSSAASDGPHSFQTDLSNLSISMLGNLDTDLGVTINGIDGSGQAPGIGLKSDQIRLVARQDIKITVENSGAGIVIKSNGDIVITPSTTGVVKLGGDDADKAILCQETLPVSIPGNVQAAPVVSTMGGVIGSAAIPGTGFFASKVLVK